MRAAKVTDADVADALVLAFRRDGYAGVAIRDLCEATGLKSASLYHRFPAGKSDMALAALARASEEFDALVLAPLRAGRDTKEQLCASAEGLAQFYEGGRLACLLAIFAVSDAPGNILTAVATLLGSWREALTAVLTAAESPDAQSEAEDRIAAVQGALMLARATGDVAAFSRAIDRMGRSS